MISANTVTAVSQLTIERAKLNERRRVQIFADVRKCRTRIFSFGELPARVHSSRNDEWRMIRGVQSWCWVRVRKYTRVGCVMRVELRPTYEVIVWFTLPIVVRMSRHIRVEPVSKGLEKAGRRQKIPPDWVRSFCRLSAWGNWFYLHGSTFLRQEDRLVMSVGSLFSVHVLTQPKCE